MSHPKAISIVRDTRGTITNILQEPCGNVAVITSIKGSVRSNHYHKRDSHWIYVLSGAVQYSERNREPPYDITHDVYVSGERFYTAINKVHRVTFLEDSVIISMSKNPQTKEQHEKDCIPEDFIKGQRDINKGDK